MKLSLHRQNMTYLKKHFKNFYDDMNNPDFIVPNIKIDEIEQSGNCLLSHNDVKCALHSVYNINREMDMLFKPLQNEDKQVIVIFGLGFGHCLDYIKSKRIKFKKVIVIEPCSNILHEVFKRRSIMDFLAVKELYLHLSIIPNLIAKTLLNETMASKSVKILFHMSYMSIFHDVYDNILRTFKNEQLSMLSSIATIRSKSIEWTGQQLKSIKKQYADAATLSGKFKDVPAVIASAGPSLEKHFGLLENIGDRAVIVAPGSATRIFNARGINAHIAMSIDSNIYQSTFYKDYRLNSILIASYRLHPDTYKNFPNDIFCTLLTTERLARYYFYWSNRKSLMIDDHMSVSMAAVDILNMMGCNPIILVGQDLSYQNNRNYADDEANSISESQAKGLFAEKDIYGNTVYTDNGYKTMQNDMELQNIKYRNVTKMYNATEGGLGIHGIENVKLSDIYEKYIKNRQHDVGGRIAEITGTINNAVDTNASDEGDGDEKNIPDFYRHLLESCNESEAILNKKMDRFRDFAKLIERGVSNNRLDNEIKRIQEYNKKLFDMQFYQQVVDPNIAPLLTFIHAGGMYKSESGGNWEGAAMYEQKYSEHALEFINILKAVVLAEMVGSA